MSLSRKFSKMILAAAVLAALAPSPLFACAACGSGNSHINSPLATGMNWGIFTLMGVIVTVLASIGSFFIYLVRRQIAFARATEQNLSEVKV